MRAQRDARCFTDSLKTSEESCLVLDGLKHNSTLTSLDLSCEIGMQGRLMLLRSGLFGGGWGERGQLCCRGLLVTLACAIGCELGDEGGRRLQSVLELNTTLTEMNRDHLSISSDLKQQCSRLFERNKEVRCHAARQWYSCFVNRLAVS